MATKEKTQQKKTTWIRKRHKVISEIVRPFMAVYCRLRYGLRIPMPWKLIKGQYLVLLNHQTPFDQFFVGLQFRDPLYYMATEDIFSNGWVSRLIRFLVAPIPIKKQTTDIKAVMNCIKIAREGGSIAIAPEGNRTYSGRTEYMNPAIGGLAKKLGLPVMLIRIVGGYGKEPRWSDCVRSGRLRVEVARVISVEEAKAMTAQEMATAIQEGLYVDEACPGGTYRHKNLAMYVERAIYVCPHCGLSRFESIWNTFTCISCCRSTRYLPDKRLEGINWDCPFPYLAQWYDYQKEFVNALDTRDYLDIPLCQDWVDMYRVYPYDKKVLLEEKTPISLHHDRLEAGMQTIPLDEISTIAVLGRNKLNIYWEDDLLQIKSDKRFCALKYVNLFYRCKNIQGGKEDGKFLGL